MDRVAGYLIGLDEEVVYGTDSMPGFIELWSKFTCTVPVHKITKMSTGFKSRHELIYSCKYTCIYN